MASGKKNIIVFFLFLILLPSLYAQYYGESTSYIITTDDGIRFIQVIVFPFIPDTIRYEVEIEKFDGEKFVLVEFIKTENNSIEVSLNAGQYRYRYTAINRMSVIEGISPWEEFAVIQAYVPNPQSYQPYYGLYFEMANPRGVLVIHGDDIFQDSEFALVKRKREFYWTEFGLASVEKSPDVNWTNEDFRGRNDLIRPNRVFVEGNMASLRFTYGSLERGSYSILIRNPGGLWAVFGEVHVGYKSVSDFTFSLNYSPMFAGFDVDKVFYSDYDPIAYEYKNIQMVERFNPVGYNIRLGWMPFKTGIGYFGFELQTNFLIDNPTEKIMNSAESYINPLFFLLTPFENVSFNVLYQTPFAGRWQHNIRLGAGFGNSYPSLLNPQFNYNNYTNEYDIYYQVPFSISVNFGYSAQFFIWKNFYAEAGLDLNYLISFDSNYPLNYLMFRPTIGLGWQFGRWSEYSEVAEGRERGIDYSVPVTQPPKAEHIISFGLRPMIPLKGFEMYGDDIYGDYSQFLWPFNPLGFNLRYAYLPFRWGNNKLGFKFEFGILEHVNRKSAIKDTDLHFLDLLSQSFIGVIYQRVLSDDWNLNLHAGIGASNNYEYGGGNFSFYSPAVNAGASAQYFFKDNFFAEAGVDVSIITTFSNEIKIALHPVIAVGYQFRRNNDTGLRYNSPNEYVDIFYGLPDLDPEEDPQTVIETQPAESEGQSQRLQFIKLRSDNSNRYNAFSVALGTSFNDPLLIATISVAFALAPHIFTEIGFDIGFLSVSENVSDYLSLNPYANLGLFIPFSGKGGFFIGAGVGYMVGSFSHYDERTSLSFFGGNFFAGICIENVFNISYTLKTDFNAVLTKISLGYVVRLE